MTGPYDDILDLPYPFESRHPRMPRQDRAAQFSPFAALTGYEAAVRETARLTGTRRVLDEQAQEALNARLCRLAQRLGESPLVRVCYFQPDGRKQGGAYRTVTGRLKRLDASGGTLLLDDATVIPLEDILELHGDCLEE